jgi:hypothetical protein
MLFGSRRALSLFRISHMKCSAVQCPSVGLVRHVLPPYAACNALVRYSLVGAMVACECFVPLCAYCP